MNASNLMNLMQPNNIEINYDALNEYSEINRLIIIGNGFDLAHGFKSSFLDFMKDYLIKILSNISNNFYYEDNLFSIQSRVNYEDLRRDFYELNGTQIFMLFNDVRKRREVVVVHESELLNKILTSIKNKSWVDIEFDYFEILKHASKNKSVNRIKKM